MGTAMRPKRFSFLSYMPQLSPEIFDPRKMDSNFLYANFGYFRLLKARDDENNENCPSYILVFGLKS